MSTAGEPDRHLSDGKGEDERRLQNTLLPLDHGLVIVEKRFDLPVAQKHSEEAYRFRCRELTSDAGAGT